MKDKILNALKSKTFFALAINIVIMALIIVVTAFSYDSADDFYNSLYICQYHNYYNNDINYIFATITGSLQYILLNFNGKASLFKKLFTITVTVTDNRNNIVI